jgi:hypothetical protein
MHDTQTPDPRVDLARRLWSGSRSRPPRLRRIARRSAVSLLRPPGRPDASGARADARRCRRGITPALVEELPLRIHDPYAFSVDIAAHLEDALVLAEHWWRTVRPAANRSTDLAVRCESLTQRAAKASLERAPSNASPATRARQLVAAPGAPSFADAR